MRVLVVQNSHTITKVLGSSQLYQFLVPGGKSRRWKCDFSNSLSIQNFWYTVRERFVISLARLFHFLAPLVLRHIQQRTDGNGELFVGASDKTIAKILKRA